MRRFFQRLWRFITSPFRWIGRIFSNISAFFTDEPEEAKAILDKTARYFTRMEVKPDVIADIRDRARAIEARR